MNFPPQQMPSDFDMKEMMRGMTDAQLLELIKSSPELTKEYDKLVKQQVGSKRTNKPLTSRQYEELSGKIDEYLDSEGGVNIEPSPGIVIKAFEHETGEKVFINVVQHPVVDPIEQKLLVDYENQPGLRIPMSVGRVKQDHDKSSCISNVEGDICKVVDAVMNPQVVQAVKADIGLLQFLAQILINYLFEKHKIKLSDGYKVMKQLTYKGTTVQFHRVKGKKAPKIEQVAQTISPEIPQEQKDLEQENFRMLYNNQKKTLLLPEFKVYTSLDKLEEYDLECKNPKLLVVEFQLPYLVDSKGILLEVNEEMFYLRHPNFYEVWLQLPLKVGKFKAKFIKKRRVLKVLMEAQPEPETIDTPTDRQQPLVTLSSDLLDDIL